MSNTTVSRMTCARIPIEYGDFQLCYYTNTLDKKEHLAFYRGDVKAEDVLIRIHSECFTGDVLGSKRCDCGEQLNLSLKLIAERGVGVLIYLRQEGRGTINTENKGYLFTNAQRMDHLLPLTVPSFRNDSQRT